jgi:hypothetical protein
VDCAEAAESIPDDNTLVILVALHVVEGSFGDSKYVRGHLQAIASTVGVEDGFCVDAEITEGIDADKDMTNVRLSDDEQGSHG